MKKLLCFTLLLFGFQTSFSQSKLVVLKTNVKILDVKEDGVFHKQYWELNPTKKLDVFYTKRFKNPINITFYSDIDSVSFNLSQNQSIDFVILLNGKDSCFTQIKSLKSLRKVNHNAPNIIPFTIGRDDRIYLEGSINNSAPIKIMYDTGAQNTGLAKEAVNKQVKINFDGTGVTSGVGGQITSQTSNVNKIQLGNFVWDDEFIHTLNKKVGRGGLAIVGYSLFSDKIVEIDYDRKIIIIHDKLPNLKGFQKIDSKWISYVPDIKTTLKIGKNNFEDWLLLDTGASGTLVANKNYMTKHKLYGQMELLAQRKSSGIGPKSIQNETVVLPEINLIGHRFKNIPITTESESNMVSLVGNLIGMDILKRFNTIIDYQHNEVYFKANSLYNQPFKKPMTNRQYWLIGLTILIFAILVITFFKRKGIFKL